MQTLGPGIAIAATGVGAGDMVAAAVAGAKYGTAILWAAAAGALLYLNNKRELVHSLKNGFSINGLLVLALALFTYLCWHAIARLP